MATIATGARIGPAYNSTTLVPGITLPWERRKRRKAKWRLDYETISTIVENPYVGMTLGFALLCGAVVSLALAFTGSI